MAKQTALAWLKLYATYNADNCLPYPFSRRDSGYGRIVIEGVHRTASYVMCEIAHGAAPSDKYEAAHSCRGANSGCVNPKHLRWATSKENNADKRAHDTQPSGEALHNAKLTEKEVREIKQALRTPYRGLNQTLADTYGVTRGTIRAIAVGLTWVSV